MPPPAAGIIVYTFAPPGDSWTSTFTTGHATVSGTYDLRIWAADEFDPQGRIVLSKTLIANVGVIHRVKSTISLNQISIARPYLGHLAFKDGIFDRSVIACYVAADGTLVNDGYASSATSGANALSADTTYEFEAYYQYDSAHTADSVLQIYIDGDLWIDDSWVPQAWEENTQLNLYVRHGLAAAFGPVDTTYHFEDFIYTIENTPGGGRWTMMALL